MGITPEQIAEFMAAQKQKQGGAPTPTPKPVEAKPTTTPKQAAQWLDSFVEESAPAASAPAAKSNKPKYNLDAKGDFEELPEGEYLVEVDKMNAGKTQKTSLDRVELTYKVIDGDYTKRLIFDNIYVESKAGAPIFSNIRRMVNVIGALTGETPSGGFSDLTDLQPIFNKCVGKTCKIALRYEAGADGNKWQRVKIV